MQKNEIRLNYQQATQLVQVERYDDALEILNELNQVKPNTENILYLMAVCHAKKKNTEEALTLCDQLIKEFKNEHAAKIRKSVIAKSSPLGGVRTSAKSTASSRSNKPAPKDAARPAASPKQEGKPSDAKSDAKAPAKPEITEPEKYDAEKEPVAAKEQTAPEKAKSDGKAEAGDGARFAGDSASDGEDIWDKKDGASDTADAVQKTDAARHTSDAQPIAAAMATEAGAMPQIEQESPMDKPLWFILFVSAMAAGLVAVLVHFFVF